MKALAAEVRSVFEQDVREINALEQRIVRAEDEADDMLWEQARQVVAMLDAGMSQRNLAAQWINARTGKSYGKTHVIWTRETWLRSGQLTDRPRFRDAYNKIANRKTPSEPKAPEPFNWILARGELKSEVERLVSDWPLEARPLVPDALRGLADALEKEWGRDR